MSFHPAAGYGDPTFYRDTRAGKYDVPAGFEVTNVERLGHHVRFFVKKTGTPLAVYVFVEKTNVGRGIADAVERLKGETK